MYCGELQCDPFLSLSGSLLGIAAGTLAINYATLWMPIVAAVVATAGITTYLAIYTSVFELVVFELVSQDNLPASALGILFVSLARSGQFGELPIL